MINSISDILRREEYTQSKLDEKYLESLQSRGYCLIPPKKDFWKWIGCEPKEIRNIVNKLLKSEGLAAGSEGKEEFTIQKNKKIEEKATRLGNLLDKNKIFRKIATLPEILWGSYNVISDDIKLSSVLFRQPNINSQEQELHIDWIPRKENADKYDDAVSFLYLEDSNKSNGATKLVPESHKKIGYPIQHINPYAKHSQEITIEAEAGSLLILNALTWHKGGNNANGKDRGIIVVDYRNRRLKQLLNLKTYIRSEIKKTLSEKEMYLFGLRENDFLQKEKSIGPGEEYRKWLKKNPQFNYK